MEPSLVTDFLSGGHGPELEEDIAIINTVLDSARPVRSISMQRRLKEREELKMICLFKEEPQYRNALMRDSEWPLWHTIARQFLVDSFNLPLFTELYTS